MKRATLLAALLLGSVAAFGQDLNSGFFLENNYFRNRLNPALVPDSTVSSVFGALVDNVTLSPRTDFGISSFLFPVDGKLVTGLNRAVSDEQFLKGVGGVNGLNLDLNYNVFTFGKRTERDAFLTFEVNVKSATSLSIPGQMFSFLKQGPSGNSLSLSNFNVRSFEYAEASAGYSWEIGGILKAGVKVKGLIGLAGADVSINNMDIDIDYDAQKIGVKSNGYVKCYTPMLNMQTKTLDNGLSVYDFSSLKAKSYGLGGFGAAVDLGVSATPLEGLEVSASVTDIGGILWKNGVNGMMSSDVAINLTSSEFTVSDLAQSLLNVVPVKEKARSFVMLPCTVHCGAIYEMPFYNKLSAGLLGTFSSGQGRHYNEVRLGASVAPVKYFSFSANVGATSYGSVFGMTGNLNLGAFQLYAGTDALVLEVTPQYIPVNAVNTVFNFGIIFQFHR